jgi:hypothetical protein
MLIYTQIDKHQNGPSFRLRGRERSKRIRRFTYCVSHISLHNLTLLHVRDTFASFCYQKTVINQGAYIHTAGATFPSPMCHPTAPVRHFTTTSLCTFGTSGFHFLHRRGALARRALLPPVREIAHQKVCAHTEPYANLRTVQASRRTNASARVVLLT